MLEIGRSTKGETKTPTKLLKHDKRTIWKNTERRFCFFFVGANAGGAVKGVNQSHLELEFNGAFCVRNETKQHLCHSPTW